VAREKRDVVPFPGRDWGEGGEFVGKRGPKQTSVGLVTQKRGPWLGGPGKKNKKRRKKSFKQEEKEVRRKKGNPTGGSKRTAGVLKKKRERGQLPIHESSEPEGGGDPWAASAKQIKHPSTKSGFGN